LGQCEGKKKSGHRCHNNARAGERFCHKHEGTLDLKSVIKGVVTIVGAVAGNAVAAGAGCFLGAGATKLVADEIINSNNKRKRIFVSFDFENDKKLKDLFVGQTRNTQSPYDVADHSLKEAAPENSWEDKARKAIARSELVIVLVGEDTHKAHGVLKEIKMARDLGRKVIQIKGRNSKKCPRVKGGGQLYKWNWDNIEKNLG
jgi:hypothetical protein